MPQTEKLRSQTLDKLAIAPWRLSGTNRPPASTNYATLVRENHSASLIRPFLDDLVQNEVYLEAREAKDGSAQLGLAVRLDTSRANSWETDLGSVLETATAARLVRAQEGGIGRGWHINAKKPATTSPLLSFVQLTHIGDWTVVGFGAEQNLAFSNLVREVQRGGPRFSQTSTNSWLESVLDLPRASRVLNWGWKLPEDWPQTQLIISGRDEKVLTRGFLRFPQQLPFKIEPWNIPTNLIHEPLHSFAAVQGVERWLSSWSGWQNLHAGPAPNQLFSWSQPASPFLDYAAAPLATAPNAMPKIGGAILDSLNPFLATNRMGKWERATNSDGVRWSGPVIAPFVQSIAIKQGEYLFGGLWPYGLTNGAAPVGTFKELLSQPNLVYYQREITGPRVEVGFYVGQILRLISRRPQLPSFAAIPWLKAIEPLLGNSTTMITKSGPNTLELSRTSDLGLTAIELHILSDWLESPQFPIRVNSGTGMLPVNPRHPPKLSGSQNTGK